MKDSTMKMTVRVSASLCTLLMGMSLPLRADIISTFGGGTPCVNVNAGQCTSRIGATTINFDTLEGLTLPYTFGHASYTTSGSGSPFVTGSSSGNWAAPPDDTTTYLTVGSPNRPGEVDIAFNTPMRYFGFYVGSPDSYNHISFQFFNDNTLTKGFNRADLFTTEVANGDWTNGSYVNFTSAPGDPGFDSIRMYSDSAAFETDNHAYQAVPDGGLTLMLLGGALVGLETLRRKFRA